MADKECTNTASGRAISPSVKPPSEERGSTQVMFDGGPGDVAPCETFGERIGDIETHDQHRRDSCAHGSGWLAHQIFVWMNRIGKGHSLPTRPQR